MNYEIKNPEIEVILDNKDAMLETWIDSRNKFLELRGDHVWNHMTNEDLGNKDKYLEEVMNMDISINYFANARFKLKTSVLIRDFFYTFSGEVKARWATTQRYSTQSSYVCSSELYQGEYTDKAFELFKAKTDEYNNAEVKGNFDQVREMMPLAYQVNYQLSCPIKQFVKMLSVLYYFIGSDNDTWKRLYECFYSNEILRPWLSRLTKYLGCDETYKYQDFNKLSKVGYDPNYEFIGPIGSVLYSQLVRHEDTYVAGYMNFMKDIVNKNNYEVPNCKCEFPVYLKQSPKRFLEMIRIRTEWFAVTDDWQSNNTWACILRRFIPEGAQIEDYKQYFTLFDAEGNFDRSRIAIHDIDDSLRLHKGYNAYYPNAFQLESRKILEQRIERYGINPLLNLYCQIFDKGYVKDNPNNKDRIKWENL